MVLSSSGRRRLLGCTALLSALALSLGTATVAQAASGTSPSRTGSATATITSRHPGVRELATTAAASSLSPQWRAPLYGQTSAGSVYEYDLKSSGYGFQKRVKVGTGFTPSTATAMLKYGRILSATKGESDWLVRSSAGDLAFIYYGSNGKSAVRNLGGGWNAYDMLVSPGDIAGAEYGDLLARTKSGDLYEYLGYNNGTFTRRRKIGYDWNIYSQVVGYGDYTGDGRNDLFAVDKYGNLYLYKGTGDAAKPFAKRIKVGYGFSHYTLTSSGDSTNDEHADLLARDSHGTLWIYPGSGKASAPLGHRLSLGSGWNTYKHLF